MKTPIELKRAISSHKKALISASAAFYKALWDQQVDLLKNFDMTEDEIKDLEESDSETVQFVQEKLGYFIAYSNSPAKWIEDGVDFNVGSIIYAMNAFDRLITNKEEYKGVFDSLHSLTAESHRRRELNATSMVYKSITSVE